MVDNEWLVAENNITLFALPKGKIVEVLFETAVVTYPFSSSSISGVFLHKGKIIPLFRDEKLGFSGIDGIFLLLDNCGESLALPVKRVIGFLEASFNRNLEEPMPKPFLGEIPHGGRCVPVIEIGQLYKQAGFI